MAQADAHTTRLYTSGYLTKGSISADEIQALLQSWQPGEDTSHFTGRVKRGEVIAKHTARRAKDIADLFRDWFLTPDDRAARCLKQYADAGGDRRSLNELIFLSKARSEPALYDFTVQRFWPACHEGALYLRSSEVEEFLRDAVDQGLTGKPWSDTTISRVASQIMAALYEAGFLQRGRRNTREYVAYRLTDFTVAYLAHDLHLAGATDSGLAEHGDWQLFGLAREDVLNRLDALDSRAGLIVQRAGSVVRISWGHAAMEDVIRAYTVG